jgi:dihydroorotate dehydrogenase (fumarate)
MIDLSTEYLGLKLKSPLVVSSSPLTDSSESIQRLEAAGAAAIVLPSIFEEQLTLESNALDADLQRGTESFSEAAGFFPAYDSFRQGQDTYLDLVRTAKKAASIPVLGSLNGATLGGWVSFAKEIEQAGADAIELNTYSLATDARIPSAAVEDNLVELVRQVKASTSIPILSVAPKLSLSRPEELLIRLHWTAILYGTLKAQIAVTGGVHSAEDVLKSIMAGAQVAMLTSALLINGPSQISRVQADLLQWMDEHEYTSIWQMRGSLSRQSVPNPAAFERGNYIKTLSSYTLRQSA